MYKRTGTVNIKHMFFWLFGTVEKKQKVSFMTTMDRELFPVKMPPNRFGNEIVPLRGAPHRGPGCYENEDVRNTCILIKRDQL